MTLCTPIVSVRWRYSVTVLETGQCGSIYTADIGKCYKPGSAHQPLPPAESIAKHLPAPNCLHTVFFFQSGLKVHTSRTNCYSDTISWMSQSFPCSELNRLTSQSAPNANLPILSKRQLYPSRSSGQKPWGHLRCQQILQFQIYVAYTHSSPSSTTPLWPWPPSPVWIM